MPTRKVHRIWQKERVSFRDHVRRWAKYYNNRAVRYVTRRMTLGGTGFQVVENAYGAQETRAPDEPNQKVALGWIVKYTVSWGTSIRE